MQGRDATAPKLDGIADRLCAVPDGSPATATARAMTEEIDIWRAAHLLVKRHGADAAIVAAQRADELLAQGDLDGQSIWKRIVSAVRELQRTKLTANERRN
jgi:triphosphoribosyl-dephospho-CoA synthetase